MVTNRTYRSVIAGAVACMLMMVGVMAISSANASAMPFACNTVYINISGGVPPGGLAVGMNYQNVSTSAQTYTSTGYYTQTRPNGAGPLLSVDINIDGCGLFNVPNDGATHHIGMPSCTYCYDVTISTDSFGCYVVNIVLAAC